MSYFLEMKGFLPYVAKRSYNARYIYHPEDRNCNWKRRVGGYQTENRKNMQVFLACESILHRLNYEGKDIFRILQWTLVQRL